DEAKETGDAFLFVRALHNVARFNDQGGFLDKAVADAFAVLKPGGVAGVVQHLAPAANADAWATGEAGYLKTQTVVDAFEAGGFELVSMSEVNANPEDQPTEEDVVWRLPPTYGDNKDDAEYRAAVDAIGESDRMTLLFRKPA
ncbi:MAG: methyltransferase, partial [Pseudomonadota bacterium]